MSGYVIMVDFRLKPGSLKAFRALIDENAAMSCATEAGCRRFDVLEPREGGDRVILYEIYDDRAAFEEHIKTAHFHKFNTASMPLVAEKTVSDYNLVCEGSMVTSGD